jgi:hypothetical protein
MSEKNFEKMPNQLELITKRWWFYLFFILLQFVPPYISKGLDMSKGFKMSEMGWVTGEILTHALIYNYKAIYPLFKIIPLLLIIGIIWFKNRITFIFDLYVAISYLLFAFLQSIAYTEKYGLAILTINLVMFLIVSFYWFWEASVRKNDFSAPNQSSRKYWVIPLAFLAFWYPINIDTMKPDFNLLYLFTNMAGLAFCLMTTVYIALLLLYYPKVNITTLKVTSLVGTIIGLYNLLTNFIIAPQLLWWNGILHLPLIFMSIYGLIISGKKVTKIN